MVYLTENVGYKKSSLQISVKKAHGNFSCSVDSRSIGNKEVIDSDVCVVGAGVAGLTLAQEFKQAKFNTCIIESGGVNPDKTTQSLYWGENVGLRYYPLDTARARFLGGSSQFWCVKLPGKGLGCD